MTFLLDTNVLIALFDPAHQNHEAAHRWFAGLGSHYWATCPITETGFVRIVSNPAYPPAPVSPGMATAALRSLCRSPSHEFWTANISLTDARLFEATNLVGHRQITDAYLAGLAKHYRGSLATFDVAIPLKAIVSPPANLIELIPAG